MVSLIRIPYLLIICQISEETDMPGPPTQKQLDWIIIKLERVHLGWVRCGFWKFEYGSMGPKQIRVWFQQDSFRSPFSSSVSLVFSCLLCLQNGERKCCYKPRYSNSVQVVAAFALHQKAGSLLVLVFIFCVFELLHKLLQDIYIFKFSK